MATRVGKLAAKLWACGTSASVYDFVNQRATIQAAWLDIARIAVTELSSRARKLKMEPVTKKTARALVVEKKIPPLQGFRKLVRIGLIDVQGRPRRRPSTTLGGLDNRRSKKVCVS